MIAKGSLDNMLADFLIAIFLFMYLICCMNKFLEIGILIISNKPSHILKQL